MYAQPDFLDPELLNWVSGGPAVSSLSLPSLARSAALAGTRAAVFVVVQQSLLNTVGLSHRISGKKGMNLI